MKRKWGDQVPAGRALIAYDGSEEATGAIDAAAESMPGGDALLPIRARA